MELGNGLFPQFLDGSCVLVAGPLPDTKHTLLEQFLNESWMLRHVLEIVLAQCGEAGRVK